MFIVSEDESAADALLPGSGGAALPPPWREIARNLHPHFQPVVHIRTGRVHGYEALLRGWEGLGFDSPSRLLDLAAREEVLPALEGYLTALARRRFRDAGGVGRLFINVQGASLLAAEPEDRPYTAPADAGEVLPVFEIHDLPDGPPPKRISRGQLGLDDFGGGRGDIHRLLDLQPAYVKIPPPLLKGVERDHTRRMVLSQLVAAIHATGQSAVAVGIETREQFYACRDIGFDHGQGFLLGRPGPEVGQTVCEVAVDLGRNDRRRSEPVRRRLRELVEEVPTLRLDAPKATLLEFFGVPDAPPVVPVLDAAGAPCGLVLERQLKPFVYSRYGNEILRNRSFGRSLKDFVVPCPVCDINTPLERVMEIFAEGQGTPGAIIVEGGDYVGLLSSQSLVRLLYEHRLAVAEDQNPLSRLPGNNAITAQAETLLADIDNDHILIYLDFDNFKPFNDNFGFRQGDRAILMFSEQFKVFASGLGGFAGHIGGDDFFFSVSGMTAEQMQPRLSTFLCRFASDVESLYDAETRQRGWFTAHDREGALRRFPLLKVSAVIVSVPKAIDRPRLEEIVEKIAAHKLEAKAATDNLCIISV